MLRVGSDFELLQTSLPGKLQASALSAVVAICSGVSTCLGAGKSVASSCCCSTDLLSHPLAIINCKPERPARGALIVIAAHALYACAVRRAAGQSPTTPLYIRLGDHAGGGGCLFGLYDQADRRPARSCKITLSIATAKTRSSCFGSRMN